MTLDTKDRNYLLHILDSIRWIERFTETGRNDFLQDRKTQDAVLRNLEIIGEAVKHLSPALKTDHPDIPWKQISGMRDKLIHEYFGVNLELVWDAVSDSIPTLGQRIETLIDPEGPEIP